MAHPLISLGLTITAQLTILLYETPICGVIRKTSPNKPKHYEVEGLVH